MYFVKPLYDNLVESAGVSVYLSPSPPAGFGSVGITFGRQVYVNGHGLVDEQGVLAHELRHVEQYRAFDWNVPHFGWWYTYRWCNDGTYTNDLYEVDARAKEGQIYDLLPDGAPDAYRPDGGYLFFRIWRSKGLVGTLGYPVVKNITHVDGSVRELRFERGLLQLNSDACFRWFDAAETAQHTVAQCASQAPCPQPPPQRRNAATDAGPQPIVKQESCGPNKNPPPPPPPPPCVQAERDAENARCAAAQAQWRATQAARPFDCDHGLAWTPPPGCPAECTLLAFVPATSHACAFEGPPSSCNMTQAQVDQHNAACWAERDRCA